jgi:hypothetical protein
MRNQTDNLCIRAPVLFVRRSLIFDERAVVNWFYFTPDFCLSQDMDAALPPLTASTL